MSISNRIRSVAILGAGGNLGAHITTALLQTGRHTITALTRTDSTSVFPSGVIRRPVDYQDPNTFVEALRGQDALVITMSFWAPQDSQRMIIDAAAKAGVSWILPNEWASDTAHEGLVKDLSSISGSPGIRKQITDLGVSSYVAVVSGLWYDWCLAVPAIFGIDIKNRKAVLFDGGSVKTSTTTWPQIGRAVAALLSLPVQSEPEDPSRSLDRFRNGHVYIASFTANQQEMLESVYRVTQTSQSDWTVESQSVQERYKAAVKARELGDRRGVGRQIYCRVFFDDEAGNHEKTRGLDNRILDLPQEDMDEFTKLAVDKQMA